MCKRILVSLALMTSICMLSACSIGKILGDRNMDIYEKIHRHYSEMERYSATLTFTAYSNKTENQYRAQQKAMGNDKFYMKVSDEDGSLFVITITNGEKTKTLMEGNDYTLTVPSAEAAGFMFVNRFFDEYYSSEETAITVGGATKGNVTTLETELRLNRPSFSKASLTINNKTLKPETLIVYDSGGKPVLKGEFTEFIYNDKSVEESDFSAD